jgi:mono/diheme cytochrome c family protein
MSYEQLPDKSLPPATYGPPQPRLRKPPFWATSILITLVVASWIPLVLIARARVTPSTAPRVSLVQDMATQPKYKEQQTSELFADGRADRPRVVGTVARGQLQADDFYYRGFSKAGNAAAKFFDGFPQQVKVTEEFVRHGQQRFNIYCSPCHGLDGHGLGAVHVRAQELQESKWVPPSDLTSDTVRARPNGHIFNTISVGIRNMPGYGSQVPVEDRWAIVAYVRAVQLSQPKAAPATQK